MSHALSNEKHPCIICFDSQLSKNTKEIPTVNIVDNISFVGDKVSEFICIFLNHILNVSDHYVFPLFYVKCQSQ